MIDHTAIWTLRRPLLVALGSASVPVLFTAIGAALAQILGLPDPLAILVTAGAVAISAGVGLAVMIRSRPGVAAFGLRRPVRSQEAWWYVAPAFVVVLNLATSGVRSDGGRIAALIALCVAVGVNEEVWFRGLVLAALSRWGRSAAAAGSAALFALLHLAGIAQGREPAYTIAQLVFAALFGLVAAELVLLTGSLWPVIAWHAAYDLSSYLGGDVFGPLQVLSVVLQCLLLASYAAYLWRRRTGA